MIELLDHHEFYTPPLEFIFCDSHCWNLQNNICVERYGPRKIEMLQPDTQQLQSLRVEGYKGVNFPEWMSFPSLKYLTYLSLEDCKSCFQLPTLGKLPSLKELRIDNMINVKYIYEE